MHILCKLGFHDWEVLKEVRVLQEKENIRAKIQGDHCPGTMWGGGYRDSKILVKSVCLRPLCNKIKNDFPAFRAAEKQRRAKMHDRMEMAKMLFDENDG